MHEMSIAQSIFEALTPRIDNRARRMVVHLSVGPLAGISADSLQFCFETLAPENGFEKTTLHIHEVAARLRCRCGAEYEVTHFEALCPHCNGLEREVLSGAQFTIDYIEVEDDDV